VLKILQKTYKNDDRPRWVIVSELGRDVFSSHHFEEIADWLHEDDPKEAYLYTDRHVYQIHLTRVLD